MVTTYPKNFQADLHLGLFLNIFEPSNGRFMAKKTAKKTYQVELMRSNPSPILLGSHPFFPNKASPFLLSTHMFSASKIQHPPLYGHGHGRAASPEDAGNATVAIGWRWRIVHRTARRGSRRSCTRDLRRKSEVAAAAGDRNAGDIDNI